jgi:linoleate 10R-lipoxygenase
VKYSRPVLLSTKMNTLTYDSVGNLAHVHFSANVFALPLKSAENPRGIFSEQELYMIVAVISTAIFFDFEPTKSFALRKVSQKAATMLGKLIEANVKTVTATSFAINFIDGFRENHNALADCKFLPWDPQCVSQVWARCTIKC